MNTTKLQRLGLPALTALAALSALLTSATAQPGNPSAKENEETKAIALEPVEVLGSRIRQIEGEGPAPVATYDRDYIRSTGALNLADFLNYLPQTYNGIAAGRSSAPNELNPEFGQRTETTFPAINFVLGVADAPPGQTGVSGVSLRGLGSGSTLILVDGRRVVQSGVGNRSSDSGQGFVNLNTIPLGMIDHVEVMTDGASALYGADAVAGVINIVLKKDWSGRELTTSYKGAFHGGGHERQVTLSAGFNAGKLRGMVSIDYYDRAPLKASQRSFSKNQNHTNIVATYDASGNPVYGRDLRLNWGYPAVIQARTGTLNGITEAGGNQTRFAVVRDGATGTPTLASFMAVGPGPLNSASGIQRGNTSGFLDLIPWTERHGFSGNFTYTINERLEAYGTYLYSNTRGLFESQPAVSSLATSSGFGNFATIVPAAYNPFGQDVVVGMIHYEFGSTNQRTRTKSHNAVVGLRGKFGTTWEWDASVGWQKQNSDQVTRSFNGAAITAALNNSDPTKRLNPFVDGRAAGITQAALYDTMAYYPSVFGGSRLGSFDFVADGSVAEIWGGTVQMATGASWGRNKIGGYAINFTTDFSGNPVANRTTTAGERDNYAVFAEFSVPLIGKPNARPGFERLGLQLAGRYEDYERIDGKTIPKVGLTWSPVKSVLLRASYSEGYRVPGLTEYVVAPSSFTGSVTDPKRNPASTTGVTINRGSRPSIEPETSDNEVYGIIYEPIFAPGLNIQLNYYRTTQKDAIQVLSAQTVVNNEAVFPDRVTRAPADAGDIALGQPGRITAVDQTFVNFGLIRNESMDVGFDYKLPWRDLGRWQVGAFATRTIESVRQLAPGQPPISDEGDTFAPPKWKITGNVFWRSGPWNGSVFVTYLDSFKSNLAGNSLTFTYPIPSATLVDVHGGYEFQDGIWRGFGKGLRLQVGIGNVFDKEPPFSDTIWGYNAGIHSAWAMGRSYEFSMTLPF